MEISSGAPVLNVGSGYGNGGMFGGETGLMFLAFLALFGMGGMGGMGGRCGVPNNIATTDTVNQAMNYSNLQQQNNQIMAEIQRSNNAAMMFGADKYMELQRDIAANAVTLANIQAKQAECCCQIKQEIAAQTLRQQEQFGALQLQSEQKFAMLNERMSQQEIQRLRDEVQQLRESNFVQYPRGFTYNAGGNPFCNCGNLISA